MERKCILMKYLQYNNVSWFLTSRINSVSTGLTWTFPSNDINVVNFKLLYINLKSKLLYKDFLHIFASEHPIITYIL